MKKLFAKRFRAFGGKPGVAVWRKSEIEKGVFGQSLAA